MHQDGPPGFGSRHRGRADGIVSGGEIHARRHRAQGAMQLAAGRAAFLAGGAAGSDQGGQQGSGRDQTEPLMDLEHMRPFVQSRLILGTTLGLLRRKAQIPQRRWRHVVGRRYQSQVHRLPGSWRQRDFRHLGQEPVRRDGNLVISRHQVWYVVLPARIGLGLHRLTRGHILDGDLSVGNHCSRGVGDGA